MSGDGKLAADRAVLGSTTDPPKKENKLSPREEGDGESSSSEDEEAEGEDRDPQYLRVRARAEPKNATEQDMWEDCCRQLALHLRDRPTLPANWEDTSVSFKAVDSGVRLPMF